MFMYITDNDHKKRQAPVITSHPQNVEILKGYKVTLEVMAYGTMPLSYQWYHEDKMLHGMYMSHHILHMTVFIANYFSGENESFCSIFPATERRAGHYYCQVENQCGVETSATARVVVSTSPTANVSSGTSGFT